MKGLKPLGDCIDRISKQAEKGYLVGLDGRKLIVRSSHSALNLKLQSKGAVLMKKTLVRCMEELESKGLVVIGSKYKPNKFVELSTYMHDELQISIPENLVTDKKIISIDLSETDTSDPDNLKTIKGKLKTLSNRFISRQGRSQNKRWSCANIDTKEGTATLLYSEVGDTCQRIFEEVGREYDLKCPVTGEYGIGDNWSDTH